MITKESLRRPDFEPDIFFRSSTAKKLKINNETKDLSVLTALMLTADMLQELTNLLRKEKKNPKLKIIVNSVYRCPDLNKVVGGSKTSQHMQGLAADIICPDFGSPKDIALFLKKQKFKCDQCLIESTWLHISRVFQNNREMFGYYLNNKFTKL